MDTAGSGVFSAIRGRQAIYNELIREVADDTGAHLLDFWRLREYRDPRMWEFDRMHMSAAGHRNMAIRVLELLGLDHPLGREQLGPVPVKSPAEEKADNKAWRRDFAYPWVGRRIRGVSSGDTVAAKYPVLGRPVDHPDGRTVADG